MKAPESGLRRQKEMTATNEDGKTLLLSETLMVRLKRYGKTVREIFYGLTIHELDLHLRKDRGNLNNLFMLVVFGDMVGLPLLPPYYSLRLLPHIVPVINNWKKSVLRERDLTDLASIDL
jgi:hypothetical protein